MDEIMTENHVPLGIIEPIKFNVLLEFVYSIGGVVNSQIKDYNTVGINDLYKMLSADIQKLKSRFTKSDYIIQFRPKRCIIQGFSDVSASYQNERAMEMLAGIIYLLCKEKGI